MLVFVLEEMDEREIKDQTKFLENPDHWIK